jgi:tryptophanyl-tRNA synthetase
MMNKNECVEAVNEFLRPMRERRAQLDDSTIEDILRQGAAEARLVAQQTMQDVREAMQLW